jgi:hypothetical protein
MPGAVDGILVCMPFLHFNILPPEGRRHRFPRLRFKRLHEVIEPARSRMKQPPAKRYGADRNRVLGLIRWNRRAVGGGPHLGVFAWNLDDYFFGRGALAEILYPQWTFWLMTAQMDQRWQSPGYRRARQARRQRWR